MTSAAEAVREVADGIYRIDVNHPQPQTTCCYLIVKETVAALIDCGGGQRGAAAVMNGLKSLAIAPAQVALLLVTHAHLDHAGAAGQLMQQLPRATFKAHPKALTHLINPQQSLIPASRALFGDAFVDTYYNGVLPLPAQRAGSVEDGEKIPLGQQQLTVLYTPGHAWHHISFYDAEQAFIVAGDAYGICYPALDNSHKRLLVPVMPPAQFNPPAMVDSIHRLQRLNAKQIGLAHYDVLQTAEHNDYYARAQLSALQEWQKQAAALFADSPAHFYTRMKDYMIEWIGARAAEHGLCRQTAQQMHTHDLSLSARGFEYFLKKQAAS